LKNGTQHVIFIHTQEDDVISINFHVGLMP